MKKRKKTEIAVAVIILILLILAVCIFAFKSKRSPMELSEDNPLSWMESQQNSENKSVKEQKNEERIVIPGFSKQTITYDKEKKMTFVSPKSNDVSFVYTVFFREKPIYKSAAITPGKEVKWDLHRVFKKEGDYEIRVLLRPFDSKNTEMDGINQIVNIRIEN